MRGFVGVFGLLLAVSAAVVEPPCNDLLIIADPQQEHSSNLGLLQHAYNDVMMDSIVELAQTAVDRGCPLVISARLIAPNSCETVSLSEILQSDINAWYYGPSILRLSSAGQNVKVRNSNIEGEDEEEQQQPQAHTMGGPQSLVTKLPTDNIPDDSDLATPDSSSDSSGDDDGVLRLWSCRLLPPAARSRCNCLRDSNRVCEGMEGSDSNRFPPMLVPGQGAAFDNRLTMFLENLTPEQLQNVHIVVRGSDPENPPETWSLLEGNERSCVIAWEEASNILDARSQVSLEPSIPTKEQIVPEEPKTLKWMEAHKISKCETTLTQLLTQKPNLNHVILAGYLLDFTIRETALELQQLFVGLNEADPTFSKPDVIVQTSRSFAMFPERFDLHPLPQFSNVLPSKMSMASIINEFGSNSILVDTGGDVFVSGVYVS